MLCVFLHSILFTLAYYVLLYSTFSLSSVYICFFLSRFVFLNRRQYEIILILPCFPDCLLLCQIVAIFILFHIIFQYEYAIHFSLSLSLSLFLSLLLFLSLSLSLSHTHTHTIFVSEPAMPLIIVLREMTNTDSYYLVEHQSRKKRGGYGLMLAFYQNHLCVMDT